MGSSRIFWKLFAVFAGLIVLTVGSCVFFVSRWQERQLLDRTFDVLRQNAELLYEHLGNDFAERDRSELQAQAVKIGEFMSCRLTLVSADGNVLADSQKKTLAEVQQMENHLTHKEFVEAIRSGEGQADRTSRSEGIPYLYHTQAVYQDDELVGFVRASQQVRTIGQQVRAIERLIAYVGFGVTLTGLLLAYWVTDRLVSPLHQLTEAAEAIAAGEFHRRLPDESRDEIGMLARSFSRMSEQLAAREAQLRESVQRHTTVLSGMAEGVLAVDSRQHVLFANAAAGKNLNFDPSKVVGLPLLEVVRNHELRNLVSRCLRETEPIRSDIDWQLQNKTLALHVRAAPLSGGSMDGVIMVLQDVSEIRRLETMRQQFVSNVSHELKTPLSSIKAYTETLLNGSLEDAQHIRHFLSRIDQQATRLNELILDLLSLARIESGQATLEFSHINVLEVVSKSLGHHEERARSAGIALVPPEQNEPILVNADAEGLWQIIDNLVDNAIKYTPPEGSVTVRCSHDQVNALIEVIDTGCGISAEHHERLFERFYRVDKARSRELGGTGLGLSIVKHLCQTMEGSVFHV